VKGPRRIPHPASGTAGGYQKLPRSFYLRSALTVARALPGTFLFRRSGRTLIAGRIVEVEAYLGNRDPASHAYRGMTQRNEVMFGEGGHLYVYFTYGMHFCCNVVTGRRGEAGAVLIRAVEPILGIRAMTARRSAGDGRHRAPRELCSGPGKLCQAFGIGRRENGEDLCGATLWIARKRGADNPSRIVRSPRIGISSGREHLWRFSLKDNPYVSR